MSKLENFVYSESVMPEKFDKRLNWEVNGSSNLVWRINDKIWREAIRFTEKHSN
jgi:hypothetical protein